MYNEEANPNPSAHWTSRNSFDEGVRDTLRLGSQSARDATSTASDALMGLMIAAPVVDSFATLGMRDRRLDALWQTEAINLESFTFTALASSLLQATIARERPYVRNCVDGKCEDGQINRSMPSGHTAFSFTGAGLLCTHHHYQSLYDDPSNDRLLCASGLAVATMDGLLRIMADRHYTTDILAGTAIGLFSGFLLPRLLHYNWPEVATEDGRGEPLFKQMIVTPQVYRDGAGVDCSFRF